MNMLLNPADVEAIVKDYPDLDDEELVAAAIDTLGRLDLWKHGFRFGPSRMTLVVVSGVKLRSASFATSASSYGRTSNSSSSGAQNRASRAGCSQSNTISRSVPMNTICHEAGRTSEPIPGPHRSDAVGRHQITRAPKTASPGPDMRD
jgi:hypothetical protein